MTTGQPQHCPRHGRGRFNHSGNPSETHIVALSILELACQLSDSLSGRCRGLWPRGAAICSVVYAAPHFTNNPCLVLCDLAHSLPWKFLSLHQSSGHDSIKDQFTVSRYYCLFFPGFFLNLWPNPKSWRQFSNSPNNESPVNSTVNGMKTNVSSLTTKAYPSSLSYYFCLGVRRLGSGD